jgi:hypothetical protein
VQSVSVVRRKVDFALHEHATRRRGRASAKVERSEKTGKPDRRRRKQHRAQEADNRDQGRGGRHRKEHKRPGKKRR